MRKQEAAPESFSAAVKSLNDDLQRRSSAQNLIQRLWQVSLVSGGGDRAEEQVHNPVQSLAGDVIPTGQLPVNPATAPLRPNKLISS